MSQIVVDSKVTVVDANLTRKLRDLSQEIEVVDEQGNALGVFRPNSPRLAALYAEARRRHTDEEVAKLRSRGGTTRKLTDILSDLEKRS